MGSARFRIHPARSDGWVFSLVAPNHRIMALLARACPDVPTLLRCIDGFRAQACEGQFEVLMGGAPGEWIWRLRDPRELAVCPGPLPRRVDAVKASQAVRRAAVQADVRLPADAPLGDRSGTRDRPLRRRPGAVPPRLEPPAQFEVRRTWMSFVPEVWPATVHAAS